MYIRFLDSIEHQNYTNYRLILTDDASTDGTYETIKQKIKQYPKLRAKTTLIHNYYSVGALANKFLSITELC